MDDAGPHAVATTNLFDTLPANLQAEVFEELVRAPGVRIERIVSLGHCTPESDWYDQDEHEWVMVLQGHAELMFDDGRTVRLRTGDALNIPAHCRHRVSWTDPQAPTIWLAVFYKERICPT